MKEIIIGNLKIIGFITLLYFVGHIACEVSNTKIITDNVFIGFIGIILITTSGLCFGKYLYAFIEGFLK